MAHQSTFLANLARIREQAGKSITDLARISGVQPPTISQMERQGLRISAANLRKCYFHLCRSDEERLSLLTQWAIWKDGEHHWQKTAKAPPSINLKTLLKEQGKQRGELLAAATGTLKDMNPENLELLRKAAPLLESNPHLRKMLQIYIDAEQAQQAG